MTTTTKPNPGSSEAVAMGCRCSQHKNNHGKGSGITADDGTPMFWRNVDCPLHGIGV